MKVTAAVVAGIVAFAAGTASAESGEYTIEVPLAAVSPAGEFPIHVETPDFLVDGTIRIAIDAGGRLTARADFPGGSVDLTGRFLAASGREAITLRSPGRGGARFSGRLEGPAFTGRFADSGALTAGTGTFSIDVSTAHPLTASIAASVRGGFGALRRGTGTVTGEGSVEPIAADVLPRDTTRLRARGQLFQLAGTGTVSDGSFAMTSWRCRGFGASASGGELVGSYDAVPDVALLLASGDPNEAAEGGTQPDLAPAVGPFLAHLLSVRGFEVETTAFADADEDEEGAAYSGLVEKLKDLHDRFGPSRAFPTRIVVVTVGHGAVRAHAAIRDLPDVPVAALIDLDGTVCGWAAQGHDTDAIGGDPVDAVTVSGVPFDLVDVVFDNVVTSLDVHSVSDCPDALSGGGDAAPYDVPVHRRPDGAIDGISFLFTETTHDELYSVFGETLPRVGRWLVGTLAPPMKR